MIRIQLNSLSQGLPGIGLVAQTRLADPYPIPCFVTLLDFEGLHVDKHGTLGLTRVEGCVTGLEDLFNGVGRPDIGFFSLFRTAGGTTTGY